MNPFTSHYQLKRPIDWDCLFARDCPLEVEIGFGLGEFLIQKAKENPSRNFVGIEQDRLRIKKTLRGIQSAHEAKNPLGEIKNIRILHVDAFVAFERLFSLRSIDRIYCLFPCPWPKRKHIKHRLFSHEFFNLLNSRLKSAGEIQIVTDFCPYFEWMLSQVKDSGFEIRKNIISSQFNTKYERKWVSSGQKDFYELSLKKERHIEVPVKKDIPLRDHFADDFYPELFPTINRIGDISVVQKQVHFDEKQKRAAVKLVVVEPRITQYVRVAIRKSLDGWRIALEEEQDILPTEGVALALQLVYESVKETNHLISRVV